MADDVVMIKHTNTLTDENTNGKIIKRYCYTEKGGGSAYGGEWVPKDENSKRFLGEPDSVETHTITTGKGSYDTDVKYGDDGKAIAERHYTDHGKPHAHSNPHDHEITWENNHPNIHGPVNYHGSEVPVFKCSYLLGGDVMNKAYNPDDHKFKTLGEFKFYLSCGANVGFEFNGVEYGIEGHDNRFDIWIYNQSDIATGITLEETLDFKVDGVKIRDLILNAKIIERIM